MPTITLVRGDRGDVDVDGLVDRNGAAVHLGASDVLSWTAKAYLAEPADEAFLAKGSAGGGITFTVGASACTLHIVPGDWSGLPLPADATFIWDLQRAIGGDPNQVETIARGGGLIEADVTGNPIPDPPVSVLRGPCVEWVTVGEVMDDPRAFRSDGTTRLDPGLIQTKIDVASEILYRLTARLYAGICADTVRPTQRWFRTSYQVPSQWQRWYGRFVGGMTARNPHRYEGSGPTSEITLGAYPVREIVEVRIDGAVVSPAHYRLDDQRWLVRLDPGGLGWPASQDMAADPMTALNTFQVQFLWGQSPPAGGVEACKRYAIELAKGACGDPCALPERVQSLQMQGVSYTLLDPMTFLDQGRTGIYEVDAWIASVNPHGLRRRSGVLTPDFPRPVRRTATTPGS